jgi:hypothetical protein
MAVELEDWRGLVHGRVALPDALVVEQPLQPSPRGGSGTFLAVLSDQQRWWVKPQNNLQGGRVIVTEHIVGRAGALIDAPVCETSLVRIPDELAGWEFRPGATLQAGIAHASLAVDDALEVAGTLNYRERDDNRRRHVGVFALYDWCWGADDQWLHCMSDDRKIYSHDHGMYLPDGPDWTEASLLAQVGTPHQPAYATGGLDPGAAGDLSKRLGSVSRDDLVALVSAVPTSWQVSDGELEALGFFLERRAPAVAARLGALTGGAP